MWLRSTCKLQTREQICCVVIDIDGRFSPAALAELAQVVATVRTRVLF